MGKFTYLFGDKGKTLKTYKQNVADSINGATEEEINKIVKQNLEKAQEIQDRMNEQFNENTQEQNSEEELFAPRENEDERQFLYRIGQIKNNGIINLTWDDVADIMNFYFDNGGRRYSESFWRKKYDAILKSGNIPKPATPEEDKELDSIIHNVEKSKIINQDLKVARLRSTRVEARNEDILKIVKDTICKYDKIDYPKSVKTETEERAVYAMLSDIHYGISFNSFAGEYNTDIAIHRVLSYADKIIETGKREHAKACFISLMGDYISGVIHNTIRLENRINTIDQVIGVSELVAEFIYRIAANFECVYVNNVAGNHSRLSHETDDVMRTERLDDLIPYICKIKLENQPNVQFVDNEYDNTIASFDIGGKLYVSVHGDFEKDLKLSTRKIENLINRKIDYFLAGHMHIAETSMEETAIIRNGSVCGSGDNYTMQKRLFGPPVQMIMVVSKNGVEYIQPVNLREAM